MNNVFLPNFKPFKSMVEKLRATEAEKFSIHGFHVTSGSWQQGMGNKAKFENG